MAVMRNEQCILIDCYYDFACHRWIARTNSDIKRMFEQNGVKIYKDDSEDYKTLVEFEKHNKEQYLKDLRTINVTMQTKMSELQYGDYLSFGKINDINNVSLHVYNDIPYSQPDTTIYKWIIDNRQDLYYMHFDSGIYKADKEK